MASAMPSAVKQRNGFSRREKFPQGLKPGHKVDANGRAEALPLRKNLNGHGVDQQQGMGSRHVPLSFAPCAAVPLRHVLLFLCAISCFGLRMPLLRLR
jgi:hypothetical protein